MKAQAHEAEDKKAREVVEKRNKLDGMILEIEKSITENKDKLTEDEIMPVQQELEKAKEVLKDHAHDGEKLQKATDDLTQASYKIAEKLYKQDGGQQSSETKKEDEPIDAEIND